MLLGFLLGHFWIFGQDQQIWTIFLKVPFPTGLFKNVFCGLCLGIANYKFNGLPPPPLQKKVLNVDLLLISVHDPS